jgi:pimeloyl-ACP methyl ester carboxylesterase
VNWERRLSLSGAIKAVSSNLTSQISNLKSIKGDRVPFIRLEQSPLLPGVSPVEIFYRASGHGLPLLFLHGGWGYEIYRGDRQIAAFGDRFRFVIPDRTGYGRSPRITALPPDFHAKAAVESAAVLDALNIERCALWGHSDGAVIAAIMGLNQPERYAGIILEAFHYDRLKPRSRAFFAQMRDDPGGFGERVRAALAEDHGEDYWRSVLTCGGKAWLAIAETAHLPEKDFFGQRLGQLQPPTLFLHGSQDPRTEPDEFDRIRRALPSARIHFIANGGHSPHSESAAVEECNRVAGEFLRDLLAREAEAQRS